MLKERTRVRGKRPITAAIFQTAIHPGVVPTPAPPSGGSSPIRQSQCVWAVFWVVCMPFFPFCESNAPRMEEWNRHPMSYIGVSDANTPHKRGGGGHGARACA